MQSVNIHLREYLNPWSYNSIVDSIDPLIVNLKIGGNINKITYDADSFDVPVRFTFIFT